jgi:hypothetical protein
MSPDHIAGLRAVKESVEEEILARPGVTGLDIGYKEVGGQRTDVLAIRVIVEAKRDVPSAERIPAEIDGIRTDVIQRGFVQFMEDTTRYDPLVGGSSIGTCWGPPGVGTFGVVVQDNATGQLMALSNWHVLVHGVSAQQIPVTQPGPLDGGRCPSDVIGVLAQNAINEYVDCAVATITNRAMQARIAGYIGYVHGAGGVSIGDRIKKQGRSSGLTYGDVDTLDATVKIRDSAGVERTFRNQIGIWRAHGVNDVFISQGDSGSVFVNYYNQVAGLLFAGSAGNPFLPDGAYGYANPIGEVLSTLNIRIASPPKTKEQKDKEKDKEKEREKDEFGEKLAPKEQDNLLFGGIARESVSSEAQAAGRTQRPEMSGPDYIGPLAERLSKLEATVDELRHFINPADRPDLSQSALQEEPDLRGSQSGVERDE